MGEAINLTEKLYPGFLQRQPALHFMLKVRQFIEMVSGNDDSINNTDDNHTNDQDMANSNNEVHSWTGMKACSEFFQCSEGFF